MHVVVEGSEPFAELRVVLNVGVDLVESRENIIERLAVGESLEKGSELDSRVADGRVVGNGLGRLGALVGNVLSVTSVVLKGVKEPSHGLLVVLVALAFDDNLKILSKLLSCWCQMRKDIYLLKPVDELISPLLGQLIVDEVLGLLNVIGRLLPVFLRDSIPQCGSLAPGLLLVTLVIGVGKVLVGLSISCIAFVVGSALNLFLLLRQGSIGVTVTGHILSVRTSLLLAGLLVVSSGRLKVLSLGLGIRLGSLGLVVGLTSRSSLALVVNEPRQ